ncbi:tetratricopeptide repeat protein [Alteromonas macleodii]|uniref:Tetratricopeptide repeat protein n=1 Tax=Alteromonas macleodii TaxID=28108 RepID=A0A6T9Y5C2_ALTMA|nr:tetratricopeptide repeat protein [Alteromonas macleodii]CAB9495033.1 Tetratricopeptide repeat protein [Alteromonas macleodii]
MKTKSLFLAIALMTTVACQSTKNTSIQSNSELTPFDWQVEEFARVDVEEPASLFALSDQQKQHFLSYYNSPTKAHISPNFRLAYYLNDLVSNFSYAGDTLKAQDVLNKRYGNCMSLALLTTALARLVNLDVVYQQVHTPPLYRRFGKTLTTSTHVRSIILGPEPEKTGDSIVFRGRAVIDYFPSSRDDRGVYISEADFISMYYQNMSAEVMSDDPNLAYSYLYRAMQLTTTNASTLNSLAVLYRSNGYEKEARKLYEFAIENHIQSVHTLSNFAVLLKKVGDVETLSRIGDMYLKTDDDNPYRWIDLGNAFLAKGKLSKAEMFFNKAIATGPYLGESYSAMAKTYFLQGKVLKAENMMEKALSLSLPSQNRALYTAKLKAIRNSH